MMTANEFYTSAYVGGKIRGVQIRAENATGSSISASSRNGVYYVYQGTKFQLLSLDGVTIPANDVKIIAKELHDAAIPSTDIKLMIDTAGLKGVTVTAAIMWEV